MEFANEGGKSRYTGSACHRTNEACNQQGSGLCAGWAAVAERIVAWGKWK
jgi:hypothetical protein